MDTGLPTQPSAHQGDAEDVLVAGVARRGLALPVLFLLDVASPFRFLAQQMFWVVHPLFSPWAGDRLLPWARLLEDGEALERVRRRLAACGPAGAGAPD